MLAQEVDAFLQNGGLVHLASVARQHGAQFLDEHVELVSPLLFRLVPGNSKEWAQGKHAHEIGTPPHTYTQCQ